MGVEPTVEHILSVLCLPVPPQGHTKLNLPSHMEIGFSCLRLKLLPSYQFGFFVGKNGGHAWTRTKGYPKRGDLQSPAIAAMRRAQKMAEEVGFEPTVSCPTTDFKSVALNQTQPFLRKINCLGGIKPALDSVQERIQIIRLEQIGARGENRTR